MISIALLAQAVAAVAPIASGLGRLTGASQTKNVLHSISGTVLDQSGAAVANATIALLDQETSPVKSVVTDRLGNFRIDDLGEGAYLLSITAEGFGNLEVDVMIGAKPLEPFKLTLAIAARSESVNVSADNSATAISTNASENQNSNGISRDALDRVPVFDQNYVATLSRFLDDNIIGTSGVSLVVNGVEANGPGVSASAVQEVKINNDPYSARFARPGRARLELVTKSGTPEFHGTVNFLFRDAVFDARNPFFPTKPPEQRRYEEGSLTGPLGTDKHNTFLLSAEHDAEDLQAIVSAHGPNGLINLSVPAPTTHSFVSLRLFHDFANGDQFWAGYSYEDETLNNQNVGGTVLPEAGYTSRVREHELNFSYRHSFSPEWLSQLRFLVGHNDQPVTSLTVAPQIIVLGSFVGGGAQANSKRTESHFDGQELVTYASGKHLVNFGVDVPDLSRRGADDFTNQLGTYTFSSIADYNASMPASFLQQRGQGHLIFWERVVAGFAEDTYRWRPNVSLSLGVRYYFQNYFHNQTTHFAPRMAIAYSPTKTTVIRAGAGLFYDRSGPRPIADLLHFNGVNLFRYIATNPSYPITPGEEAALAPGIVILDPNARIPRILQYSGGIERQITERSTLSINYVGSRGMDLFRSRDINAPRPGDMNRPNPALGQVRQIESEGYQKSNAMEVTFRGKPVPWFTGQAQYTLSKTYNNTSGITYFPDFNYNPSQDWARSDNDRRNKFDLLGAFQAKHWFSAGVALSAYSGKPVNVTTGLDTNYDGLFNERPLLPDGSTLPRNTLHGPGLLNLDLNAEHDFMLSKQDATHIGRVLTVAVNWFDVLNHVNYVTYLGVLSSPDTFGRPVQSLPARRIQFNLQFKF